MRYFYEWTPLLIIGAASLLVLPGVALIALAFIALLWLAAVALPIVAWPRRSAAQSQTLVRTCSLPTTRRKELRWATPFEKS